VSCESPTELNFPQPLGATAFVFTQFNAFFEVFRIVEHCLNIGCPQVQLSQPPVLSSCIK